MSDPKIEDLEKAIRRAEAEVAECEDRLEDAQADLASAERVLEEAEEELLKYREANAARLPDGMIVLGAIGSITHRTEYLGHLFEVSRFKPPCSTGDPRWTICVTDPHGQNLLYRQSVRQHNNWRQAVLEAVELTGLQIGGAK